MEQVREASVAAPRVVVAPREASQSHPGGSFHSVRSTLDVVDRGLVTLALVWQALWLIGDASLWPTNQGSAVAATLIWASMLTWLGLAVGQARGSPALHWFMRVANVSALLAATIAVLLQGSQVTPPDWSAASSLAVLPAAMAGLLFPSAVAGLWTALSVSIEAAIIFGVRDPVVAQTVQVQDILFPAYALCLGVVTLAARNALMRDARAVDLAAADVIDVEQERVVVEEVEAAVRRDERLLHATVLNTLTAILRGGLGTPELAERLRERCREAADVMRQVRQRVEPSPAVLSDGQWLDRDLSESIVDLYTDGVTVNAQCGSLQEVPAKVYDAIVMATREALANVHRHAEARTVWIDAQSRSDRSGLNVRVRVRDDGRGFEVDEKSDRFGVRSAMVQSLIDVGGTSRVRSQPGQGTTVEIEWGSSRPANTMTPFRPAARAFAFPILIAFGVFTALELALTREEIIRPGCALAAFAIFVGLAVLVAWSSMSGSIPWWVVLVVAGFSPLIYQLQAQSVISDNGPWTDWASGTIVALFVVVAGGGPSWSWLVLVATWLFIQGDVLHEVLAAGTALIIAAALFGRSTRRNAAAVDAAQSRLVEERAAVALAGAGVRRMSSRYGALRESRVTALLDGIAEGRIDPDDSITRFHAALEERFIRTVVKVDPAVDSVHALATSMAVRALRRGVFLDVDISDAVPPGGRESLPWPESFVRAIECSEPGEVARFSARDESGVYVIRLVTPVSLPSREEMRRLPVPGVLMNPAEAEMLWELRIQDGGRT
jgi:signal transduction histidine kinase